ncbi:MAG: site-2 protease family protein [Opitutales bacterium]
MLATSVDLQEGLVLYLILVASLSVHEWAHAFSADKLGDPLPRAQGRVTLNPLAHIDLIGTVILPLAMIFLNPGFAIFGWGKPVQVSLPNPRTRVRDDLLITGAGPLSNLALALVGACIGGFVLGAFPNASSFRGMFEIFILLNCLLFLFNLIPVPPLDGSRFLKHAVGMSEETYAGFARYGFLVILVLINLDSFHQVFGSTLMIMAGYFTALL